MAPELTLIHLVSGQTMQNLLPLLAFKPSRVIQLRSADPRFAAGADHLERAAAEAGCCAEFRTEELAEPSPGTEAVRHFFKQTLSVFPSAAVNITGGTKLMSLGAYLGASGFPDVPIVYCDTDAKSFVHAGGRKLPADLPTFADVAASLDLRVVMAAHGKSPGDWRFDTASEAGLGFGETAWGIRTGSPGDFEKFGGQVRKFFRGEHGKIPEKAGLLDALAAADFTSAIPGEPTPGVGQFLAAAARAGFLAPLPGGGYRLADGPAGRKKLRSHVERLANLLDGSWLELSVLAFISRSPSHRDPHRSVEPAGAAAKDSEYGETDIVAVHTASSSLEIVSCKTVVRQPLEHLEALRTRANNLGGNHARATLAVLDPGDAANEARLRRWGKLLRVNVLIGSEIPAYFSRTP